MHNPNYASRLGNQNAASWTEERTESLKKLWAEGLSASQIVSELGEGVTRSGVLGKVHRLKLPGRKATGASAQRRPAPRANGKGQPKAAAITHRLATRIKTPTPPSEPFDMEDGEGVDVTGLVGIMKNEGCKWIHGDPLGQHGYCGKPFKAGSVWCPVHHARVYPGSAR